MRMTYYDVRIGVAQSWVDDGFTLRLDRLRECIMDYMLRYAETDEVTVNALPRHDAPTPADPEVLTTSELIHYSKLSQDPWIVALANALEREHVR